MASQASKGRSAAGPARRDRRLVQPARRPVFLPIELLFHPLEKASRWLTNLLYGSGGSDIGGFDPIRTLTRPVVNGVASATGRLNDTLGPLVMIVIGVLLIFLVVEYQGNLPQLLMIGRTREALQAVGRNDAVAMVAGGGVTTVTVNARRKRSG